jgi:hypothetical protein
MTEQMNRNNGLGARRDRGRDQSRIDVVSLRIDIDIHGPRTRIKDGRSRGDEGERRGDHFLARAYAGRQQSQMQRTGSGIGSDAVLRSVKGCELLLKRRHFRAQNKLAGFERPGDGFIDFRFDAVILRLEVGVRDHRVFSSIL